MKVTDLKEQKNSTDRYSVYVDGKYSFSITTDDLLSAKLRVGYELSEAQVDAFKQQSSDSLLMARAYEKCMRRPHSEREIRDYLRTKKAGDELTEEIIAKCYKHNLLNDEYFAERWVEHRRRANKSNRFIKSELFKKGVDQSIIDTVLDEPDDSQLTQQIEKKRSKYETEEKLIAYLQRQGFSYGDIKSALSREED